MIKNDNSEITFQYKLPWVKLQKGQSISLVEPDELINTKTLSKESSYTPQAFLRIRARLADKTKRDLEKNRLNGPKKALVKNSFKTFDVHDRSKKSYFTIDIVDNKFRIKRIDGSKF